MTDPAARTWLATVGYQGRSAAELVQVLLADGVGVVLDVRLLPLSRRPGMSRTGLAATLGAAGIGYRHLRALGNPPDNRAGFRAGEAGALQRYQEVLLTREAGDALTEAESAMDDSAAALLCVERDVATCHRGAVAAELARRRPGLRVSHL